MTEVNRFTLWLDSKYRTGGTNAVPEWELDQAITLSNPNNELRVECLSATVPFSFHQMSPPSNTIPYTVVSATLAINVSGTLTIPSGNWNITELLDTLGNLLTAALTGAGYPVNKLPTWSFTYASTTARCTLGISNISVNHEVAITLQWSQADLVAPFFGFDYTQDTVLSYNNAAVNTSTNYLSPNAVNVSPTSELYLRSDSFNQVSGSQERLVESFTTLTNILAKVPLLTEANTLVQYQSTGLQVKLQGDSIKIVQLYWTSTSFTPVVFEGINWRVCLQVTEYEPTWLTALVRRATEDHVASQAQVNGLLQEREELLAKAQRQIDKIKERVATK